MKLLRVVYVCMLMLVGNGVLTSLSYAGTEKLSLITAWCDGNTAYSAWDLPSTAGMGKTCLGSNVRFGVLVAPDGAVIPLAFYHFRWPSDFLPAQPVKVVVEYTGSIGNAATNIRTQVSIACVGDGETAVSPTYNPASALNTPGPTVAGVNQSVTFPNVNVANCAAGEEAILKLGRSASIPADTYTGDAQYLNVEVSYSRQ